MRQESRLATAALIRLGELTNRTFTLPLVVFYLTSRCNSRCVSCDWWKSSGADDLTFAEIDSVAESLLALGTRVVLFSGGEPLLRAEVFDIASLFAGRGMRLQLLTSGVLLERLADDVVQHFERVTISLDAVTEADYRRIRGVSALAAVERGVAALRRISTELPISARTTLHRLNYRALPDLVEHARAMGLDGISFLPADVSSSAFGRERPIVPSTLTLSESETVEFEAIVEHTIDERADDFTSGFIAESPDKLRRLPQYYAALAGRRAFPPVACNAPWVSLVVEANGSVRPCFFHQVVGNVREASLEAIVGDGLLQFRRGLNLSTDPLCMRCVCSMNAGWRNAPWH